jgi:hypothetical protein
VKAVVRVQVLFYSIPAAGIKISSQLSNPARAVSALRISNFHHSTNHAYPVPLFQLIWAECRSGQVLYSPQPLWSPAYKCMGYRLKVGRVSRVKCPLIAPTTLPPCWVTTHRGGGGGGGGRWKVLGTGEKTAKTQPTPRFTYICICGLDRQTPDNSLYSCGELQLPSPPVRLYPLRGTSQATNLHSLFPFSLVLAVIVDCHVCTYFADIKISL